MSERLFEVVSYMVGVPVGLLAFVLVTFAVLELYDTWSMGPHREDR